MSIKYLYLPLIAFLIKFAFSYFNLPEFIAYSLEYEILLFFVLLNIRGGGIWPFFVGLGAGLNFFVIMINGFRMPLHPGLLEKAGKLELLNLVAEGKHYGYALIDGDTKFSFLADVIGISFFDRLIGFASIGDILLLAGVLLMAFKLIKQLSRKAEL